MGTKTPTSSPRTETLSASERREQKRIAFQRERWALEKISATRQAEGDIRRKLERAEARSASAQREFDGVNDELAALEESDRRLARIKFEIAEARTQLSAIRRGCRQPAAPIDDADWSDDAITAEISESIDAALERAARARGVA